MMAQYAILAALFVVFGGPLTIFIIADSNARHNADEAYAAGYRDGQRAEFAAQARAQVERQSAALQRQQAEDAARAYKVQRGMLG